MSTVAELVEAIEAAPDLDLLSESDWTDEETHVIRAPKMPTSAAGETGGGRRCE
jgi:hypothetical protein